MIRLRLGAFALLLSLSLGASHCAADMFVSTGDGVLRFDRDGNSSVFSDIGTTGGLAFSTDGDLFVSYSQQIRRFDAQTGEILDSFRPSSGFGPGDLIFGPDGNLYSAAGRDIRRMGPGGEDEVTLFENPANNRAEGLAFDNNGNLFASLGNDLLVKLSATGEVLDSVAIPGSVFAYNDLVYGPSGTLFATTSGQIQQFSTDLTDLGTFARLGGTLKGMAFDEDGSLYVSSFSSTNQANGSIYRISADGQTIETFATGLRNPTYITFSPTSTAVVPEPASLFGVGVGLLGLGGYACRSRLRPARRRRRG